MLHGSERISSLAGSNLDKKALNLTRPSYKPRARMTESPRWHYCLPARPSLPPSDAVIPATQKAGVPQFHMYKIQPALLRRWDKIRRMRIRFSDSRVHVIYCEMRSQSQRTRSNPSPYRALHIRTIKDTIVCFHTHELQATASTSMISP